MKVFFEYATKLEQLKGFNTPTASDLKKVLEIIKDDVELTLYFYNKLNSGWLELLDGEGQFEQIGKEDAGIIERYKSQYLNECAEIKPQAVSKIIKKSDAKDWTIQAPLIGAILKMPEEIAAQCVPIVKEYLAGHQKKVWYGIGENSAKLVEKLVGKYPDEAFEIANVLLDAWVPPEKERRYGEDIISKFSEHDYKKLMMEHYSKIWEVEPERAIGVLVKILNRCLKDLDKEGKGEEGYDASRFFGYGLELGDLNEIDIQHPRIKTILVKGICEAGRILVEKKPEVEINKLLNQIEETKRIIFLRIAIYLLRFVKPSTEKERINKFIGDEKFFVNGNPYWHEHRLLLNDKFDDVSDEAKKIFLEWVDKDKYSEGHRKKITERCEKNKESKPDFEKWENQSKAEELYLVRDKFKDLYEEYKNKSGVGDDALAPRRMVSEARCVSPMESTPLKLEEMTKKSCDEVLDFILKPSNYEKDEKADDWHWDDPKYGLSETFKNDVKQRPKEYLSCDLKKNLQLGPYFLSRLFYGLHEVIRAKDTERDLWTTVLELASEIVKKNGTDKEYETCFSAILSMFRDGFGDDNKGIEFNPERVKILWEMIETLTRYPIGDMSRFGDDQKDPIQIQCNFVPGQAMELSVPLGIVCKKNFIKFHEEYLKNEIRRCYERILKDIRVPGVNCTFGLDFARIYWTNSEWIKDNLEKIFCGDLWDETWGAYVSWGRPSPQVFKLLFEKGLYSKAVDCIGAKSKYKFGKEPDEGLVEHLMTGYFNGWVDFESDVFKKFFENAPIELRGKAASFMTTGFKPTKEGKDEKYRKKVEVRMRVYWKNRLAAIKSNPTKNEKEAIEFTGWVEDSLLPAKETLELLEQTLNMSGGQIGENRNAEEFVKGVCALGKGNEVLALSSLKRAAADKNMHAPWSRIEEQLVKFLEELPKGARSKGREVADLYGRHNPDKFRGVWEKLNN